MKDKKHSGAKAGSIRRGRPLKGSNLGKYINGSGGKGNQSGARKVKKGY